MKIDNSPARGMRDLLPADVAVRDHVLESISAVYRRFGYQRIETPALENIDRLQSGEGADNEKLIFEVLKRGLPPEVAAGTPVRQLVDLGLRYDLTVPLTRFYGNNHAALPLPFRSLQVGPVWRADRPQKGRYRQFYQCDIDIIGEPSVLAEAELIEATSEALGAIGLTGTTIRLSDRRFLAALGADCGVPPGAYDAFFITLDKLDKIGWVGVQAELAELGFPPERVAAVTEKIQGLADVPGDKLAHALADSVPGLAADVIGDLATTAASLDLLAAERPLSWQFDPTLVRGMGYYTGQVFEVIHRDMTGSVAGGGRYDKLIGRSLGQDVPACGFSIGFERIVDLLSREQTRDAVAVLVESDVPVTEALAIARELREASRLSGVSGSGRAVETVRRSGKFGTQLKRLEAAGFGGFMLVRSENGEIVRGELRGPRRKCRWPGLASCYGHHSDSRSVARRLVVGRGCSRPGEGGAPHARAHAARHGVEGRRPGRDHPARSRRRGCRGDRLLRRGRRQGRARRAFRRRRDRPCRGRRAAGAGGPRRLRRQRPAR